MNAKTFLTPEEKAKVESTIAEVEKITSAELVCAVATESGRYDRAESMVGILFSLIILLVLDIVYNRSLQSPDSWEVTRQGISLIWQGIGVLVGFILGTVVASHWHSLRRIFTGQQEIREEMIRSASHVFSVGNLTATQLQTGILLYISLFERQVMILADKRAMEILGQKGIDELRDIAVSRLKSGKRLETFTDTLHRAGEMLKETLPPHEDNPDEIPNTLLLFDPRP